MVSTVIVVISLVLSAHTRALPVSQIIQNTALPALMDMAFLEAHASHATAPAAHALVQILISAPLVTMSSTSKELNAKHVIHTVKLAMVQV